MRTYRKIQLVLVASLLWSSTSVSSLAATSTITPGKNKSVTVKIPVESLPSRQLNLTRDTNLIAQSPMETLGKTTLGSKAFSQFDNIWKNPADRSKRLFDYCNSQKDMSVKICLNFLLVWLTSKEDSSSNPQDVDEASNIINGTINRLHQR